VGSTAPLFPIEPPAPPILIDALPPPSVADVGTLTFHLSARSILTGENPRFRGHPHVSGRVPTPQCFSPVNRHLFDGPPDDDRSVRSLPTSWPQPDPRLASGSIRLECRESDIGSAGDRYPPPEPCSKSAIAPLMKRNRTLQCDDQDRPSRALIWASISSALRSVTSSVSTRSVNSATVLPISSRARTFTAGGMS